MNHAKLKSLLPRSVANRFFQSAWVVNDLRAAAQRWIDLAGAGPFYIFDQLVLEDLKHRGRPAEIDFSAALAQAGNYQIELIRQGCARPSAYRDLFAPGAEGFHHFAIFSDDYVGEVQSFRDRGLDIAAEGRLGTVRYCYVDTAPMLGFMIEIIEDNEPYRRVFGEIAAAARDWDGRNPIRSQNELGQLTAP
jgi:hypothetical protein